MTKLSTFRSEILTRRESQGNWNRNSERQNIKK